MFLGEGQKKALMQELLKDHELSKDTMLHIWNAYFIYRIENKHTLSRYILANYCAYHTLSIEQRYQLYRCRAIVDEGIKSEIFRYLKMRKSIDNTVLSDLKICRQLKEIWKQLLSSDPSDKIIRKKLIGAVSSLKHQNNLYLEILKESLYNTEILSYYGTFLIESFGKGQEGQDIVSKAINIAEAGSQYSESSPFSSDNGVVVFNCISGDLIVAHTNRKADEILRWDEGLLLGQSFDVLIPQLFKKLHKHLLSTFFAKQQLELNLPSAFFLLRSDGYLVFVKMRISVDSIENSVYFVLVFAESKEITDESIVILSDGTIVGHTKKFTKRTSIYSQSIIGENFKTIFPRHSNITQSCYENVKFSRHYDFQTFYTLVNTTGFYIICLVKRVPSREENFSANRIDSMDASCPFGFNAIFGFAVEEESPPHADQPMFIIHTEEESSIQEESSSRTMILGDAQRIRHLRQSLAPEARGVATVNSFSTSFQQKFDDFKKVKRALDGSIRSTLLSSLLIFIIAILSVSSLLLTFNLTTDRSRECFTTMEYLNRRNIIIEECTLLSRVIDLKSKGLCLEFAEDLYVTLINENLEQLIILDEKIRDDYEDSYTDKYKRLYIENKVPVWILEGNQVIRENSNLFDVTSEYIRHLTTVSENYDDGLTLENPDLYYLYRNGYEHVKEYSYLSMESYKQEQEYFLRYLDWNYFITTLLLAVLLSLVTWIITLKQRNLQTISNRLWSAIYHAKEGYDVIKYNVIDERIARLSKTQPEVINYSTPYSKNPKLYKT